MRTSGHPNSNLYLKIDNFFLNFIKNIFNFLLPNSRTRKLQSSSTKRPENYFKENYPVSKSSKFTESNRFRAEISFSKSRRIIILGIASHLKVPHMRKNIFRSHQSFHFLLQTLKCPVFKTKTTKINCLQLTPTAICVSEVSRFLGKPNVENHYLFTWIFRTFY